MRRPIPTLACLLAIASLAALAQNSARGPQDAPVAPAAVKSSAPQASAPQTGQAKAPSQSTSEKEAKPAAQHRASRKQSGLRHKKVPPVKGPAIPPASPAPTPAPVAAQPQLAPPVPATLMNQPPVSPTVTMQNGLLTIDAPNSMLSEVLQDVSKATGAQFEGPTASERIAVRLGPGDPRQVIAALLQGTPYDYVILGSQENPDAVTRIVLTTPTSASATAEPAPPPANNLPPIANPVEPPAEEAPPVENQPPPVPQPQTAEPQLPQPPPNSPDALFRALQGGQQPQQPQPPQR